LELAAKMNLATIRSVPSHVYDPEISLQLSKEALGLAHDLGESPAEAKIHWNLMLYYLWAKFDFAGATEHGEAALKVARESDLTVQLGPILNDLGTAYLGTGRVDDALAALEESRGLLRDSHDLPLLAQNLTNSSSLQFITGQNEPALRLMDEAEKISQSIENAWGLAGSLYYRGTMHLVTGRWGEALADLNRSIEQGEKAKADAMLATSILGKATYCALVGATESGISLCRQATQIYGENLPMVQGYPWGLMSLLYLIAGELGSAREALQTSLDLLSLDMPPTPAFASIEVRIAEIKLYLAEGRPDLAERRAGELLDYLERFHVRQFRGDALLLKGRALLAMDRPREANDIFDEACCQAEELSALPALWQILGSQADALELLGNPEQAASKREQARAILRKLAGAITVVEDRATFLALPDVRQLSGAET